MNRRTRVFLNVVGFAGLGAFLVAAPVALFGGMCLGVSRAMLRDAAMQERERRS